MTSWTTSSPTTLPKTSPGLHAALLILHSPQDGLVSIDEAAKIYRAARHPKSLVALSHADHLLTKDRDAAYVGRVIAAWSSRYLES